MKFDPKHNFNRGTKLKLLYKLNEIKSGEVEFKELVKEIGVSRDTICQNLASLEIWGYLTYKKTRGEKLQFKVLRQGKVG